MKYFIVLSSLLLLASCTPSSSGSDFTMQAEEQVRGDFNCKRLSKEEAVSVWKMADEVNKKSNDANECYVQLNSTGFTPGSCHTLYSVNLLKQKNKMFDLVANQKGELCTAKGAVATKDICMNLGSYMNGEEQHFLLVSANGENMQVSSLTPRPIMYTWKDGATVIALVKDQEAQTFMLAFRGFKPNETVKTISESGKEKIDGTKTVNEDGNLLVQLMPATIGAEGGSAKYTIIRDDETGTLEYNWGNQAKK